MIKNSFVLYTDYYEQIKILSHEDAGILLIAIMEYVMSNEEPEFDSDKGMLKMAFSFIKAQLDRDMKKYEETIEKRREAGKKGGLTKVSNAKQKVANARSAKQTVANQPVNVNVNVNDNDIKKESSKEKVTAQSIVNGSELGEELKAKVLEWIKYKSERKESYKEVGLRNLITQIRNQEIKNGTQAVCDVITLSISNGWKGIIWDKVQQKKAPVTTFHNFENKHNYNYAAMEELLLKGSG